MRAHNPLKIVLFALFSISFLLCITSCDKKAKTKKIHQMQVITAKVVSPVQKLFFSGILLPISNSLVISELDGTATNIYFNYGEKITAGQKLISLDSKPLAKSYRDAVKAFLKAKQDYDNGKLTYAADKALYAAGVNSKADFISQQATYDNNALTFLQTKYELEKILKTANVNAEKIEQLSLSDTAKINTILQRHFQDIIVYATGSGVALFPPKNDNSGGSSGVVTEGSTIKTGQLLLAIGDLSGLKANFTVSEINIDRIKTGMDVIVTGNAFPNIVLHGSITSVSAQAKQDSGGSGLSVYAVEIKIPNVNAKDMEKIRVGMTAKFEIDIKSSPKIMLPINAIFQKNGNSYVNIMNATGKPAATLVETGETTPVEVEITSGVKSGDKVLVGQSP